MSHLGVPEYIGSGNHTSSSVRYRFMVMKRFGKDLEKIFTECGRQFSMPTVCYLALRVVSVCIDTRLLSIVCVCMRACARVHVCVYSLIVIFSTYLYSWTH